LIYSEPMANNTLQTALHQLADKFAKGVVDAFRSASLDEILENAPVRRQARTASVRRKGRKRALSNGTAGADMRLNDLVETVKNFPAGLRSEELRSLLNMEKVAFRLVAREAVEGNLVRRMGEKRATTFFPVRADRL